MLTLGVEEQILRLQIAVEHAVLVAEGDAPQQLIHEGLDGGGIQSSPLAAGVHVHLEVLVHVLECPWERTESKELCRI
jgi:hypothetical protein